jgi:hypothetical protein
VLCTNNHLLDSSTWTFGQVCTESSSGQVSSYNYQVLAMTLLIPPFVALLSATVEKWADDKGTISPLQDEALRGCSLETVADDRQRGEVTAAQQSFESGDLEDFP